MLKSDIKTPQIGRVRIQGPIILTAGMFELPPEVSIIDPRVLILKIQLAINTISQKDMLIYNQQNEKSIFVTMTRDKNIVISKHN